MSGVCLFFYSFACFCAMFTGQLLALPVFYAILNWLAMVVNFLVTALMEQFFYGYQANYLPAWVEFLTPVSLLRQACYWGVRDVHGDGALVRGLAAPQFVALYAGIGVVFALLALWVYRGRQVESAGDVVSVPLVRPVFKYGVALCSGLCLGVFTTQILGWYNTDSTPVLVVCVLLWTAAGYFAAEMLLKKSFRVLRAWKGCAAAVAVMAFLCAVCVFDLFGVVTRVPDPDRVVSMAVDTSLGYPGSDSQLNLVTSDREIIQQVTELHRAMVDERDRQGREAGDDYIALSVTYTLDNGSTLQRQYYSVPIFRDEIDREGTLTWQANQFIQDRTVAEKLYNFDGFEGWRLTEVDLYDVYQVRGGLLGLHLSGAVHRRPAASCGRRCARTSGRERWGTTACSRRRTGTPPPICGPACGSIGRSPWSGRTTRASRPRPARRWSTWWWPSPPRRSTPWPGWRPTACPERGTPCSGTRRRERFEQQTRPRAATGRPGALRLSKKSLDFFDSLKSPVTFAPQGGTLR